MIIYQDRLVVDIGKHSQRDAFYTGDDGGGGSEPASQDMSRGALRGVKWHRLVCDEAAFIKNLDTQRAKAVHRLKKSHVWLATGSPVQNNIKELQTLLRLCKFSGGKYKTHLFCYAISC